MNDLCHRGFLAAAVPSSLIAAFALCLTLLAGAPACAANSAGQEARGHIKHVVIIVQENRTLDNIFGGFPGGPTPFPGADAVVPAEIAPLMKPARFPAHVPGSASHDVWQCLFNQQFSVKAWQGLPKSSCTNPNSGEKVWTNPFSYLAVDLRASYWDIAKKYVLGDKFFAVTSTSSFPGHQFIVADQSLDTHGDIVADQPYPCAPCPAGAPCTPCSYGTMSANGCFDSEANVRVPALGINGFLQNVIRDAGGECYDHKTVAEILNAGHVSWKHYVTKEYDLASHQFIRSGMFDGFINSKTWYKETSTWPTSMDDLKNDIQQKPGRLAQVTWVKPPCMQLSDHPGSSDAAANWVGSVVNWIGGSPYWKDTVIFVLWDDWGGFYDHVHPPTTRPDRIGPGLRTPFLVISPFGVNGTVVHSQADYGSVLKFVEDLFGLGSLTEVDRDARDLNGFFDFTRQRPFMPVYVKSSFVKSMCPMAAVDKSKIDP